MKKLFSLAMVAALVFAVVGCEKKADDGTGGASTNAPAAK